MNINIDNKPSRDIEPGDLVTFMEDMHRDDNDKYRIVCRDYFKHNKFFLLHPNTGLITVSRECCTIEEFIESCNLVLVSKNKNLNLTVR